MNNEKNYGDEIYGKPDTLMTPLSSYCPGCGHGIVHKIIAQVVDTLKIASKTIIMSPVGCSVILYKYLKLDSVEAAHGRASAVATGLKRVHPDRVVLSYQGDGDLLAIGTAETIHTANRGENISVIFVNNAIYGMTGGQMAPTSLLNQKTATSPNGRSLEGEGFPIRACELLNTLSAPYYIERCSVHSVAAIRKTKEAIMKAITNQIEGKGYSFVEILSMCPVGWGMAPVKAAEWIKDKMTDIFPTQIFRDKGEIKYA